MRSAISALLMSAALAKGQAILFEDSFDRANSRNIDAALEGVTDGTGLSLAADAVYSHGWIDPNNGAPIYGVQDGNAGNGGGAQVASNQLQLAVGAGTSNAFVNHNFTNASIPGAGGFSVSFDLTANSGTGIQQGGGFAIGMSQAEADSAGDAFDLATPKMTGGFHDSSTLGAAVPANVVSDFWIALRGNGSLAWGGAGGTISGLTVGSKLGTVTVNFTVTDFSAGSIVNYEVFFNSVSRGTGTFTWSGTNENYIGLDARDASFVGFDNFAVSTFVPAPATSLAVDPQLAPADNPAFPVTLTWTAAGLPAGTTYTITADKAVSFPNGGNTGSAVNGSGTMDAVVNGTLGDTTFTFTVSNSTPAVISTATATVSQIPPPSTRPNVIVILADDLGWGDLGCYGSEIPTPNLDALAANGARFRQFYNSARCSPTRCSVLTGLYPQQAAVNPAAALPNLRDDNNVTFAEMLGAEGYHTYMAGKWHLGNGALLPESRGFQHVWRVTNGQESFGNQWNQGDYTLVSQGAEIPLRDYAGTGQTFYQTDAIGDYATDFITHSLGEGDGAPFAMYLAFGAPHFPIQAPSALTDTFMSTYAQGWDVLRLERYNRQLANGVIDNRYPFPGLGGTGPHQAEPIIAIPAWNTLDAARRADLTRRMSLYATMVKKIDDNVGKIVAKLQQSGQLDNTLIMFLSDNGGNHERGVFGTLDGGPLTGAALTNMGQPGANDNIHYGGGWAHLSNTPLKLFKHFTHEGGIRAPMIVHWPDGISTPGSWVETPAHLIDVMGTIVDATGAAHPSTFGGHPVLPLEGISLIPAIEGQAVAERPLFVEHESNRMIRKGKWKLVTEAFTAFDNEFTAHQKLLYDMDADPGETTDLAGANPAKVVELVDEWNAWCTRVGLPASRLMAPPPVNLTPAPTAADLFLDTFNRANAVDIDAANSGMSGSRMPPLGSGTTWFEGWEGGGTSDSIQTVDSILQMATGVGMSENGLNHNFTGQDILDAGGFSVSLRVLGINTDPSDSANRFAGFGVGLNAAQAAGGNDINTAAPTPIRGNTGNPGTADCFLELDLDGNVKLWTDGVMRVAVPVGKTQGTLTASYACSSFAAGSTVTISAFFDGTRLDLDPGSAAMHRAFVWDEADANHVALSARASNFVQMDNFAVRKLPLSSSLGIEYLLDAGLEGEESSLLADPDGDGLDNFGEWAFGTDPARSDSEVAATALVLVQPSSGTFRFAHRRLTGFAAAGLAYRYQVSTDLTNWNDVAPIEESAVSLPATPGYEAATLALPAGDLSGENKLFVKVAVEP
jgi:arylsulfatase A-like enzyme